MDKMILDTARLKLDALEREAEKLRAFIKTYNELAKNSDQGTKTSTDEAFHQTNLVMDSKVKITSPPSPKEDIINAARNVLMLAAPQPMLIGELFDELVAMELNIGGQNPKGNLSAKLSQPEDLVYVKDEGWYYRPTENDEAVASSDAKAERAEDPFDFLNPKPSPPRAQD